MTQSRELVFFGVPGLVALASRGFETGGSNNLVVFQGIRIGGECLYLPKNRDAELLCRLRLRCEKPNEMFETCGYVSDDFAYHAFQSIETRGIVTVGGNTMVVGKRLSRRPLKGTVPYHLLIELIEDSAPF